MDKLTVGIELIGAVITFVILVACLAENRVQSKVDRYLIVLCEVTVIMNLYAGVREVFWSASNTLAGNRILQYCENLMIVMGIIVYTIFVFSYYHVKERREHYMIFLVACSIVAGGSQLFPWLVGEEFSWGILIFVLMCDAVVVYREGKKQGQFYYLILLTYCFAPLIAIAAMGAVYVPAIHLGFDLSVFIIYVGIHVEQGIRSEEKEKLHYRRIAELEKNQKHLIVSQIQPHFIYNSLNSINYLIDESPELAQRALVDFSDYLRVCFDHFENTRLIPFSQELEHIKTYLWMEKLRFEDDLSYRFEIGEENFLVPGLSIQPLVENAVNHGLSQKRGGGELCISSKKVGEYYRIVIADNGVGMTERQLREIDRKHSGIALIREQMMKMCKGTITVESVPTEGTRVEVMIPAEDE